MVEFLIGFICILAILTVSSFIMWLLGCGVNFIFKWHEDIPMTILLGCGVGTMLLAICGIVPLAYIIGISLLSK